MTLLVIEIKVPSHELVASQGLAPALAGALQDCGGEAPLAKKLGVSIEVLSGWLRGHDVLPPDMYLRARVLAAPRRR